ncbi:MAG: PH domain-containing protein [Pseudoclavibacter sp.]
MAAFDHPAAEWRRVSAKYVVLELVGDLIMMLIFSAVAVWLAVFIEAPVIAWIWPVILAVISIISALFSARRARAIGYQLRDDDLLFRRGLLFSRLVAVPYGRMQLVDVQRGPIARMLGLANLKMVTAAAVTNVQIPGLPSAEAEQLRDHLIPARCPARTAQARSSEPPGTRSSRARGRVSRARGRVSRAPAQSSRAPALVDRSKAVPRRSTSARPPRATSRKSRSRRTRRRKRPPAGTGSTH